MNYLENKLQSEYHFLTLWYYVSFITGIVTYFSLAYEPKLIHILLPFIFSAILLCFKRNYSLITKFFLYCFIAFNIGIMVSAYRAHSQITEKIPYETTMGIKGTVCSIKPTTRGLQLVLKDIDSKKPLSRIRINVAKQYLKEIFVNDQIEVIAKLFPPQRAIAPGGYDFGVYAHFASISATGYALSELTVTKHHSVFIEDFIYHIRQTIYTRLVSSFGSKSGNFIAAILIGEIKGIEEKTVSNMRLAGVSHILCVSGLHLSLVVMILFVSIRFLLNISDYIAYNFNIKTISAVCAFAGSYFYLQLSGGQIAATRAFIMTSVFIISTIIGRTSCAIRSIAIAASIILTLNPEYIFHPSFQLSFAAVLSLVSGYEFYLRYRLFFETRKTVFSSIKFYFISNIYSSFLASMVTAPLVLNQFYIFSTYSIAINLIAVPIMSFFLMPLSIITLLLIPFNLEWILKTPLSFCVNIITDAAEIATNTQNSVLYMGHISPLSLILFLLGFAWICLWGTKWRFFGVAIMLLSLILMLNTPKAELIFNKKINALGIKNDSGVLEIYANNITPFERKYWANWFGQKDATVYPYDQTIVDKLLAKKLNNKSINETQLLDGEEVIAIFCDKKKCRIQRNSDRFY